VSIFGDVYKTTAQGKLLYAGTEIELVGFKGSFFYGYDVSLSVNLPSYNVPAMPYPAGIAVADQTQIKPKVLIPIQLAKK
jgi:hypothetical protein